MRLRVFLDVEVEGEPWQEFPVPYAAVKRIEAEVRRAMGAMVACPWEVVDLPEGLKLETRADGSEAGRRAWAFMIPDELGGGWSVRVPVQRSDGSRKSEIMIAVDPERKRGVVEVNFEGVSTWVTMSPAEAARLLRGVMKMAPALRTLDELAVRNLRNRTGG